MNGTVFQEKEERKKKEGMTYLGPLDVEPRYNVVTAKQKRL